MGCDDLFVWRMVGFSRKRAFKNMKKILQYLKYNCCTTGVLSRAGRSYVDFDMALTYNTSESYFMDDFNDTYNYTSPNSDYGYSDSSFDSDPMATFNIYTIGIAVVQYLVPLLIISVAYIRMGKRLWSNKTPGAAQEERDQMIKNNKKKVYISLLWKAMWK